MSIRLTVVAETDDATLAGVTGTGDGPVIALGSAEVTGPVAVRWLDRAPSDGDSGAERLVAPAGEGLWRTAPWPAADSLFDAAPAAGGRIVAVGDPGAGLTAAIVDRAAARGIEVEPAQRFDAGRLEDAACVILCDSPQGALPARAFSVLAAGRLLMVPRLERSFGLEDGLDHLEFGDPDEAVALLVAHARDPAAFARVIAWGRLKAEPQRASVVYRRLADDLLLHGVA